MYGFLHFCYFHPSVSLCLFNSDSVSCKESGQAKKVMTKLIRSKCPAWSTEHCKVRRAWQIWEPLFTVKFWVWRSTIQQANYPPTLWAIKASHCRGGGVQGKLKPLDHHTAAGLMVYREYRWGLEKHSAEGEVWTKKAASKDRTVLLDTLRNLNAPLTLVV